MSEMRKLRELCSRITDGSHYSPEASTCGYPMLSVKDMDDYDFVFDDCKLISDEEYEKMLRNGCVPHKNDVVIAKDGSYLKEVFVITEDRKIAILSSIGILRPNTELIDPYYLKYYLSSDFVKRLVDRKYVTGSALPRIILENFGDIDIPYVPIDIQKILVSLLKDIDAKIANNNSICSNLESMAKLLYDYWFVQFDFPDENGKPYKSSGGKMVWNDELKREIPAGWEAGTFGDCISSINTGLNPRNNFKLNTGGTIKYLTVKNLTKDGMIDFSSCDFIDETARSIVHRRSDIKVGDILFASIAPLGRGCIISDKPEDWDINESVFSIRPDYQKMTSVFLYMTFMSDLFIKKAEGSSVGSVFKGIRISELQDLKTVIPPKSILDSFGEQVEQIHKMKSNAVTENQQLASLRDFLLPMLMNGQVKVGA